MLELLEFAVTLPNMLYTILLVIVLLYWLLVILGALDMGGVDIDLDADADIDGDVDVDGGGNLATALHFFNFGQLPFMVIMTFWVLSAWTMAMWSNYHYGADSLTFAAIWLLPILCIGLVITKVITTPLIPIFQKIDMYAEAIDFIGQTGTVTLPTDKKRMGQAEIEVDNNNALINIKSNGAALEKGTEIMIIEEIKDKYFIVEPLGV